MKILLVEDDRLLGDGIEVGLTQDGYNVEWVTDGAAAAAVLLSETYDLVILDLNLPWRSGLEVLKDLRQRDSRLPVLILTARDTITDRVKGLDSGADDYLVKPFDLEELSARVRALLRRSRDVQNPTLVHGPIQVDPAAHIALLDGQRVDLPSAEFALLKMLMESAGRVVTRERIEQALYGWSGGADSNTIEVYIHHLRKKFGASLIRTIRGVGYMIEKKAS